MSNEVAILKRESESAFMAVLTVGKEAAGQLAEARQAMDPVAESMAMAFGIAALQDAMKENPQAIGVLLRMGGHKWGFKTDRDAYDGSGTQYKPDVLVPCFCEALMNQLRPIGNEFNVITSSMYITKEGWAGLLSRLPGVTEVDSRPGAIVDYEEREFTTKQGATKKKITASVSATADCKVWGQHVQVRAWKTQDADERLQLSVIAEEIDEALDQLKGKADARILERLHQKVKALSLAGPQGVPQAAVASNTEVKPNAAVITQQPEQTPVEPQPSETEKHEPSLARIRKILGDNPDQLTFVESVWNEIAAAKTQEKLEEAGKELAAMKASVSQQVLSLVRPFYQARQAELKGGAA
jgi:hypothetical protein